MPVGYVSAESVAYTVSPKLRHSFGTRISIRFFFESSERLLGKIVGFEDEDSLSAFFVSQKNPPSCRKERRISEPIDLACIIGRLCFAKFFFGHTVGSNDNSVVFAQYKNDSPMKDNSRRLTEKGWSATNKTEVCQHLYDIVRHARSFTLSWPDGNKYGHSRTNGVNLLSWLSWREFS